MSSSDSAKSKGRIRKVSSLASEHSINMRASKDSIQDSKSYQFLCNSCSSPLFLDRTFLEMESTSLTELGIANQGDSTSIISTSNTTSPMSELSREVAAAAKLFDIVSGAGELDHPLCEDCADSLLDQLDRELKATEELCRDYSAALTKLESSPTEDILHKENKSAMADLSTLEAEATHLKEELARLEHENSHLDSEITKELDEQRKFEEEQQKYYRRYVDVKRKSCDLEDDYYSLRLAHTWADRQLNRLTQTSGLSAAFHIWHSDHFGTINGLRLGRLPTAPVDSAELNAAWGSATMLLYALAKRLNIKFRRYRPVPYGSHSYIEVIGDQDPDSVEANQQTSSQTTQQTLPLYTTGGGIRFMWDERYDDAMAAFAECVSQLVTIVEEKSDGNFKLPYPVERDRLLDRKSNQYFSVRSRLNSEQHWTRALKMLLTNLKWATSFVSSPYVTPTSNVTSIPSSMASPSLRDEQEHSSQHLGSRATVSSSPSSIN